MVPMVRVPRETVRIPEMRVSTLKTRGITTHAITMESHVTGSSAIMSESNRACNLHSWLLAALQCVHSQKHVCCTRCKRIPQSSNLLATDGNNRPKWPRSIVRDPRHDRVRTSPPPSPQDTILNFLYFFFFLNRRFSFPPDGWSAKIVRSKTINFLYNCRGIDYKDLFLILAFLSRKESLSKRNYFLLKLKFRVIWLINDSKKF